MWERLKRLFTGRTRAQGEGQEADVRLDPAQPGGSTSFAGLGSGDDGGYAGETGAERRTEQER